MLTFIDLKEGKVSVDYALAIVEIEIDRARSYDISAIKVLHGYGSHGKGGTILIELRKYLSHLKHQGNIKNFYGGDKWNIYDKDTLDLLKSDKSIYNDEDLDKANPGITIIIL